MARCIDLLRLSCFLALFGGVAGCGLFVNETPPGDCESVADCKVPTGSAGCRAAVACDSGACVFEDAPDGTALSEQTLGDCATIVCDGKGASHAVAAPDDVEDDGDPCTLDTCSGTMPTHTSQGCACVPGSTQGCYSGPMLTQDIGICHGGTQVCDADGAGFGPCMGEQLPKVEDCDSMGQDENCDGAVNEGGASCLCGDGSVSADVGEQCDDGGNTAGDGCDSSCHIEPVLSLAVRGQHSCALLPPGRVKCWGTNFNGDLGLGDQENRGDQPGEMASALPFVDLGSDKTATFLASGLYGACAVLNDATLKCWGTNSHAQLGLGDKANRGDGPGEMGDALSLVSLGSGQTVKAVTLASLHGCALLTSGKVKCWGDGFYGQLGLGDQQTRGDEPGEMGDSLPMVDLGTGKLATAITAGVGHSCALLTDGHVKCWGANYEGELGLGDTKNRGDQTAETGDNLPPIDLGTGKTAVAISAGHHHTCALLNDGTVKCWGQGLAGALGLGDAENRGDQPGEMGDDLPAVDLGAGKTAVAISCGSLTGCAILDDGSVKCWGAGLSGGLGQGDTNARGDEPGEMGDNLPPIDLGTGKTATLVSAGDAHVCVRLNDATVKCWGFNASGQLGIGDKKNRGNQPDQLGDSLPIVHLYNDSW
jgi:cysteine-rich repeat protein